MSLWRLRRLCRGLYSGDGTLVDGLDDPATFTQPLDGLDVIEAPELAVSVDFPRLVLTFE